MRFIVCGSVVSATIAILTLASAAVPAFADTWKGYIVDQQCSQSIKDNLKSMKEHSRLCALAAPCKSSGYMIYADKKWLSLDKSGNEIAEKALRASKDDKGFYATVEGDLSGTTIKVKKLAEAPEAAK